MHFSYHTTKKLDTVINFEIIALIVCLIFILFFPLYFNFKLSFSLNLLFLSIGTAVCSYLMLLFLNQSKRLSKDIHQFHLGVVGKPAVFKYFWYPFLVSIPEELLFRLVLPSLTLILIPLLPWNVLIANILFGMAHIRKGVSPLVPLTAFVIGVIFAVVFELSGKNILSPILAHYIFTVLRVNKFARS